MPHPAFYSNELNLEGKDQIGSEKEQSTRHPASPRSITRSHNDPKHENVAV